MKLIMPIDDAVELILDALPGFLRHVYVKRCQEQRWSEYNTNVLEYEYDYFEHA